MIKAPFAKESEVEICNKSLISVGAYFITKLPISERFPTLSTATNLIVFSFEVKSKVTFCSFEIFSLDEVGISPF